jgi:hypothetical protein
MGVLTVDISFDVVLPHRHISTNLLVGIILDRRSIISRGILKVVLHEVPYLTQRELGGNEYSYPGLKLHSLQP